MYGMHKLNMALRQRTRYNLSGDSRHILVLTYYDLSFALQHHERSAEDRGAAEKCFRPRSAGRRTAIAVRWRSKSNQANFLEENIAYSLVAAELLNLRSCEVHQSTDFLRRSLEVFYRECIRANALDAESETHFKHLRNVIIGRQWPSNRKNQTRLSAKNPSR